LIRYHASWVVPINEPPIHDGWVAVDRGRVVALGRRTPTPDAAPEVDLGRVAILPGLVNAHTHLELSYLRDLVPPASEFITWMRTMLAARRQGLDLNSAEVLDAIDRAIDEAAACGTVLIGDISNTLVTLAPLTRSSLAAVVFYELIGFNAPDPTALVDRARQELDAMKPTDRVRTSLAAHAPYSVAPLLLRAIHRAVDRDPFLPCSVHLAESAEEVEFIEKGTGPWRHLLEELGAWNSAWMVPGVSPVQYLDEAGFLSSHVLAVHGVQMSPADLSRLAARGATLVTCPRSNGHTGAGAPPLEDFYRAGVRVAVGTDSLASAPDLNVFAELATMRALAPSVPAASLLESATREGARALGFEADYGTIEPGKRARLLAVGVPPGTGDVEEYLVTGIHPEQVRWIE
jgi:cytosine/adenosine deaminase-related metal-dependent hydrolase